MNSHRRRLADLVGSIQAGFWGSEEAGAGKLSVRVIRNGDAARSDSITPQKLPVRWVTFGELERARTLERDIILVSSGEVGKVARMRGTSTDDLIVSNFVRRLRPASDVDPSWLFHLLRSERAMQEARRSSGGTALQNLSWSFYSRWSVFVPSLHEQRRAAEILDALDDQMRLVESAASKLRATFSGLLVHLLTRGTQTGSVPLGDAVLEFGETSVSLPKSWTVEPVDRLLRAGLPAIRSGPFGSALLKHELVDFGVPLLGIDNVHADQFVSDFRRFVTPARAAELSRYRVHPHDVMITIMGTVGRSCLVPEGIGHALSSKHVWTLTFDDARYRPYLASLQLNHAPWARAHLRRDEQGGIMNAIRSDTLRTLMLPTPPIVEQLEIEAILRALEFKIANEERSLMKLRILRAGLEADLLTGRVRVSEQVGS